MEHLGTGDQGPCICKENCSRETVQLLGRVLHGFVNIRSDKIMESNWASPGLCSIALCVYISVYTYMSNIIVLKRFLHDILEKKEERVKKKKKELICKIHIAGDVGSSSAFYKEHTKGVEPIHQPSTSLQHNSSCSDFLLRLVILLFIRYSETSLTLMSYLKKPHLFEMRSCPLTYIKGCGKPPFILTPIYLF